MRALFFASIYTLAVSQTNLLAQGDMPYRQQVFQIHRTDGLIQLDGVLEEEAWRNAASFSFIRFRPDWGDADDLTELKVTFDDRFLYVGATCLFPEGSEVISRNLVRDGWQGDDWLTFHIDSYGDSQNAFVFSMYPPGSRYDMSISNDGIELGSSTFNSTYDMLWEGKSHIQSNGWSMEMKIPLSDLRFQKTTDGRIFSSISSARTINARNELYVFPAIPQEVQGDIMRPSAKQPVEFVDLEPKKQLLVSPYIIGGRERASVLSEDQRRYETVKEDLLDAGLDIRYAVSPKMTLDLTYNTDFAQVEADDQVVNLQRFSVIFPEKRRFFQEQAGLYEVRSGWPTQLFYSRNIGIFDGQLIPIFGGGRLNGKLGTMDVGALSIQTSETSLADGSKLPGENFSTLRLRNKVLNDRSFVGFLGTSRVRDGYENYLVSGDAIVNLKNDFYLSSSWSYAYDSELRADVKENSQFYFGLNRNAASGWIYTLDYNFSGATFNPGIGFLARSNYHKLFLQLDKGKFNRKGEGLLQYTKWTWFNTDLFYSADNFTFETWYNLTGLEATTFSNDNFEIYHIREFQRLEEPLSFSDDLYASPGDHFFHYALLRYSPARQRQFNHRFTVRAGTFYGGNRLSLQYDPRVNLGKHLNLTGSWRSNYLDFRREEANVAQWLHLIQLKVELALDLHLSGSWVSQYNTTNSSFFNNARIRYNFRDGHDFYLVYNETLNTDRFRELPNLPQSAQQTFVVKYTYTFYK